MHVQMDPVGPLVAHPLKPHRLVGDVTAAADVFTVCHLGVPRFDPHAWALSVEGLVAHPMRLALDHLHRMPQVRLEAIHQCQGSPLDPDTPTRRIADVRWRGVRLADVLAQAGVDARAKYVCASGADRGTVGDVRCDAYVKDFPIERLAEDVLLALDLDDAPLSAEHGAPVRLVIPGCHGTNSVKWLTSIRPSAERADSLFTTRFCRGRSR